MYANARFEQAQEEFLFKAYVTESLRLQGEGKVLAVKFADLVRPKEDEIEDGDEIVVRTMNDLGLKFGG